MNEPATAKYVESSEITDLRANVREFLAERYGEQRVRQIMDAADVFEPALWAALSGELGLTGILIPERVGGIGCGCQELLAVTVEFGRALTPSPFFSSSVLAASAVLASKDHAAAENYLPAIADGSLIGTIATYEAEGFWNPTRPVTRAQQLSPRSRKHHLTGEKLLVTDGTRADILLVTALAPGGPSMFAVRCGAEGLTTARMEGLDPTRPLARVSFRDTPAELLGNEGAAVDAIAHAHTMGRLALAGEQAGGSRRVLEMAVAYAKTREQFGKPIGSYQAIKHKLADMLVGVECAESAAYEAAWVQDAKSADAALAVDIAKAFCSETYSKCAADNIQIHGGIGFTWEHPAHLYFRKARSTELLLGTARDHRERVIGALVASAGW